MNNKDFDIDLLKAEWTEKALTNALISRRWIANRPEDTNDYDIITTTPSGHRCVIELKALSWDLKAHKQAVIERWQNRAGTILPGWLRHYDKITHVCLMSMHDCIIHFNTPNRLIIQISIDNERPFKASAHDGNGLLVHIDWNNTGHTMNIKKEMNDLKDSNPLYKQHLTTVYNALTLQETP